MLIYQNNNRLYPRAYDFPSHGLLTRIIVPIMKFFPMKPVPNPIRKWLLTHNSGKTISWQSVLQHAGMDKVFY